MKTGRCRPRFLNFSQVAFPDTSPCLKSQNKLSGGRLQNCGATQALSSRESHQERFFRFSSSCSFVTLHIPYICCSVMQRPAVPANGQRRPGHGKKLLHPCVETGLCPRLAAATAEGAVTAPCHWLVPVSGRQRARAPLAGTKKRGIRHRPCAVRYFGLSPVDSTKCLWGTGC